jgi:hypothetical protein
MPAKYFGRFFNIYEDTRKYFTQPQSHGLPDRDYAILRSISIYIRIWISPSTGKSPCALGESPFSHSALDIKTYAMALLKKDYRQSSKRNMPRRWFDDVPHTHVALDDAIEQGALFCNMLAENRIKEA